eukprot:2785067-Pyramimonas_sp.AAC.1
MLGGRLQSQCELLSIPRSSLAVLSLSHFWSQMGLPARFALPSAAAPAARRKRPRLQLEEGIGRVGSWSGSDQVDV